MLLVRPLNHIAIAIAMGVVTVVGAGCATHRSECTVCPTDLPRELDKVSHPEYVVEPPDILQIEAIRAIPKPPYRIDALDAIFVQLANPILMEPLTGLFSVEPDGTVNLGATYGGSVKVMGMTIPEAKVAIENHLKKVLKDPVLQVSIGQAKASQRIAGPHLVRPDGTIALGSYGSVKVVGLTLTQVKKAIEDHLVQYLDKPEVMVDVQAYNSKTYYVILDGAGNGQQVIRLPATGNETVLDAIANVYGLSPVSSKDNIWVARPAPNAPCGPYQILPVDWCAVSTKGDPTTNFQILPGDRVYVDGNHLVAIDTYMARLFAPIERLLGITLLGTSAVRTIENRNGNGINNGGF